MKRLLALALAGAIALLPAASAQTNRPYNSPTTKVQAANIQGTVGVTQGGTGNATATTAYGLQAAGTTATGAHQTVSTGATTDILVSGGASALPVWTTATGTGAPVRAGSPVLTGTVTAAALKTASGSTGSIATATPTTIFTLPAAGGIYTVQAWIASTTASVFGVTSVIKSTGDITVAQITEIGTSSNIDLTITGAGAVQVTQTAGSNQIVLWVYQAVTQ